LGRLRRRQKEFCDALVREGYSPRTSRDHVHVLAHLNRWLSGKDLDAADVGRQAVERFCWRGGPTVPPRALRRGRLNGAGVSQPNTKAMQPASSESSIAGPSNRPEAD
jgi:hypothetical protein